MEIKWDVGKDCQNMAPIKCHHTPKSNKISLIISRISGYEENSRMAKKGTI